MILNKYNMTLAQFDAIQPNEEYHIFFAESKKLSEKTLKLLCVFAPVKVIFQDGTSTIFSLTDLQTSLETIAYNREQYAKLEQLAQFAEMLQQSETLRELWTSASNPVDFIERCYAWTSANNDFHIIIQNDVFTYHYYDIRQSGEYIDTRTTWARYKGKAQRSISAHYEDTLLTVARGVMLLEFYLSNHFPFDDCPENHRDENGNPRTVLPVSACPLSVEHMMY